MGKEIDCFNKNNRSELSTPTPKKPVFNIQLLIHHLQVIPHKNLSRLDLIINTLLTIKTITTSQIQMTFTHV